MKTLLKNVSRKRKNEEMRDFIREHVSKISLDEKAKTLTLHVDKRYSYNTFANTWLLRDLEEFLHKMYTSDYEIRFSVLPNKKWHDREMMVPQKIRR